MSTHFLPHCLLGLTERAPPSCSKRSKEVSEVRPLTRGWQFRHLVGVPTWVQDQIQHKVSPLSITSHHSTHERGAAPSTAQQSTRFPNGLAAGLDSCHHPSLALGSWCLGKDRQWVTGKHWAAALPQVVGLPQMQSVTDHDPPKSGNKKPLQVGGSGPAENGAPHLPHLCTLSQKISRPPQMALEKAKPRVSSCGCTCAQGTEAWHGAQAPGS